MNRIQHKNIRGVETKWCSREKHWVSIFEFNSHIGTWDRLDNYCRPCKKKYQKTKYEKDAIDSNKVMSRRNRGKKHYQKTRDAFLSMYGNVCACCGETEEKFLTIEHKNGLGHKERRALGSQVYTLAIKEYRPDLYETLCMNCNHVKGRYGYCPHKFR